MYSVVMRGNPSKNFQVWGNVESVKTLFILELKEGSKIDKPVW